MGFKLKGTVGHWMNPPNLNLSTLLAILILWAGININALAQAPTDSTKVFVAAPLRILEPLENAKEYLAKAEYAEAVNILGEILKNDQAEDYLLVTEQLVSSKSIRTSAETLIGGMPRRGREIYRLKYGIEAKKELATAIEENDVTRLQKVFRCYYHTEAGQVATWLLALEGMERGQFGIANVYFRKLHTDDAKRNQFEPELSIRFANSLFLDGKKKDASQVILDLKETRPVIRFQRGDEVITHTIGDESSTLKWLEENTSRLSVEKGAEWRTYRQSIRHETIGDEGDPLKIPNWTVTLSESKALQAIRSIEEKVAVEKSTRIPAANTIAVKNTVLMRTPDRLYGIDLLSGKRIWQYPWRQNRNENEENAYLDYARQNQLQNRLWQDGVSGRLSSDGQRVYFVESNWDSESRRPFRTGNQPSKPTISGNTLVCLNIVDGSGQAVEGQFAWKVDSREHQSEVLKNAYFLGPPTVVGGLAYVLYEIPGQIRLAAFAANRGELVWSQQISRTDGEQFEAGTYRRRKGAVPLFRDGNLFCPTMTGGLVSFNLATRSFNWGRRYDSIESFEFFSRISESVGWSDNTMMMVNDQLIFTPVDSDKLYSINPADGKLNWEGSRDKLLMIAGTFQKQILAVGPDFLSKIPTYGYSVGKRIELPGEVAGRGFVGGNFFYQPITQNRLLKINLSTNKIDSVFHSEYPLGNLACYQGRIFAHSTHSVTAFYQAPYAEKLAELLLTKDAQDPLGALIKAQLLGSDQIDEAIELTSSVVKSLNDHQSQRLLVDLLTEKISRSKDQNPAISRYENLISDPLQRRRYLIAKIETLPETASHDLLVADVLNLIASYRKSKEMPADEMRFIQVAPDHQVAGLRLVQKKLLETYQKLAADEKQKLTERLFKFSEQITLSRSVIQTRVCLELFRQFDFLESLMPNVVRQLIRTEGDEHWTWAEGLILARVSFQDPATMTPALLDRQRRLHDSLLMLYEKQLKSKPNEFTAKAVEECRGRLRALNAANPKPKGIVIIHESTSTKSELENGKWKDGMTRINLFNDENDSDFYISGDEKYSRGRCQLDHQIGRRRMSIDTSEDGFFTLRNEFGEVILILNSRAPGSANLDTANYLTRWQLYGNLLLVSVGHDLMAIDISKIDQRKSSVYDLIPRDDLLSITNIPVDEAVIWRFNAQTKDEYTPGAAPLMNVEANALGMLNQFMADSLGNPIGMTTHISSTGICIISEKNLFCLNPWTGEVQWKRSDIAEGSLLFGDQEGLLVLNDANDSMLVLNPMDGSVQKEIDFKTANETLPDKAVKRALDNRLLISGSSVTSLYEESERLILEKVQLTTGKEIWRKVFPAGTKACRTGSNRLSFFTPEKQFQILDLKSGRVQIEAKIDVDFEVNSMKVLDQTHEYLILLNKAMKRTRKGNRRSVGKGDFNGAVMAIDKKTKKPRWQSAAQLDGYQIFDNHPVSTPVLMLRKPTGSWMHLIFVRVDDGSLIRFHEPVQVVAETSVAKVADGAFRFNFGYEWLELKSTSFPRPVEPPAQTDRLFSKADKRRMARQAIRELFMPETEKKRGDVLKSWIENEWNFNPINPGFHSTGN